jgi:protein-tyrosine phosphatase
MIEAADVIADALSRGARVLVHCEEGCERAPLVVAWFLVTRRAMTMDSAYALLQSRRPFVQDRRRWLGEHSR